MYKINGISQTKINQLTASNADGFHSSGMRKYSLILQKKKTENNLKKNDFLYFHVIFYQDFYFVSYYCLFLFRGPHLQNIQVIFV